jgi:hypothetical protein
MTNWAVLALTTVGAGAAGSIVTTYGTQSRERRVARAQARECLRQAENIAQAASTSHEQITKAMDDLESAAMIAGLPRALVDLHRIARVRSWAASHATTPGRDALARDPAAVTCTRVGLQAAQLLAAASWHPWRGSLYRWHRTRRLRKVFHAGVPARTQLDANARRSLRKWERETIQAAKARGNGEKAR